MQCGCALGADNGCVGTLGSCFCDGGDERQAESQGGLGHKNGTEGKGQSLSGMSMFGHVVDRECTFPGLSFSQPLHSFRLHYKRPAPKVLSQVVLILYEIITNWRHARRPCFLAPAVVLSTLDCFALSVIRTSWAGTLLILPIVIYHKVRPASTEVLMHFLNTCCSVSLSGSHQIDKEGGTGQGQGTRTSAQMVSCVGGCAVFATDTCCISSEHMFKWLIK